MHAVLCHILIRYLTKSGKWRCLRSKTARFSANQPDSSPATKVPDAVEKETSNPLRLAILTLSELFLTRNLPKLLLLVQTKTDESLLKDSRNQPNTCKDKVSHDFFLSLACDQHDCCVILQGITVPVRTFCLGGIWFTRFAICEREYALRLLELEADGTGSVLFKLAWKSPKEHQQVPKYH
ncbi:hypothetical protein BLNAU_8380 [Blattamonas nauphoetae]|uniref:Uncharacterized protein n=1 Tax=Blattamonas nauphoetae TaxID=2049346 RepID=A0ABQ9XYF7_9EUKA|nr:hypothetical protein BLNAU_8380 [Blattamonas nauphoetae]